MESESVVDMAPLLAILPTVYVLVDLVRPIPGIRSWMLPITAALFGLLLGTIWGLAEGANTQSVIVYAAFGFGFGQGANGANQIKVQALKVQDKEVTHE